MKKQASVLSDWDDLPTTEQSLAAMAQKPYIAERDVEFVAESTKDQIVEDLWRIVNEDGLKPAKLARAIDAHRQYVHDILHRKVNINFEIETLAKFSTSLNRRLIIRLVRPDETMAVIPLKRLDEVRSILAGTATTMDNHSTFGKLALAYGAQDMTTTTRQLLYQRNGDYSYAASGQEENTNSLASSKFGS